MDERDRSGGVISYQVGLRAEVGRGSRVRFGGKGEGCRWEGPDTVTYLRTEGRVGMPHQPDTTESRTRRGGKGSVRGPRSGHSGTPLPYSVPEVVLFTPTEMFSRKEKVVRTHGPSLRLYPSPPM